jgi:hypothetical protein
MHTPTRRPRVRSPVSSQTSVRPSTSACMKVRAAGRLGLRLTRVRHRRRGYALQPDVDPVDHERVAGDDPRRADERLGRRGRQRRQDAEGQDHARNWAASAPAPTGWRHAQAAAE